jgi:hypothetical protein
MMLKSTIKLGQNACANLSDVRTAQDKRIFILNDLFKEEIAICFLVFGRAISRLSIKL